MAATARWTAVVPVKALPAGKSRLAEGLPAAAHASLVRAMRADTLAAVRECPVVARLVVVVDVPTDEAAGAITIVQRSSGLNGALRDAAGHAARRWPADGIVALVGDLPALTPAELAEVLGAAAEVPRGFVPDADGTGTTLITAAAGVRLEPQFGTGSALRHAAVAMRLPAGPGVRQDVDTSADLALAAAVGLGPRSAAAVRSPLAGGTALAELVAPSGAE